MSPFRRLLALALSLSLMAPLCVSAAPAGGYTDVPADHWALSTVEKARDMGLMQGVGDGAFGLGRTFSRAEFVTVLSRMFGWTQMPDALSFTDVPADKWYYEAVALAAGAGVAGDDATFRPEEPITRLEMARMLVDCLDYEKLAAQEQPTPFADVDVEDSGYISLAYHIGMTNGVPAGDELLFLPNSSATREEAAAMLVRVYERYTAKIAWMNGFYAFSSSPQIDLTAQLDEVTVGWARLDVKDDGTAYINRSASRGNEWFRPSGYKEALATFEENGALVNLNVFCSDADAFLTDKARGGAVAAIVAAAEGYHGICLDAEGADFRDEAVKQPYVLFMQALREALPTDTALYVCVTPDEWFKGYDYKALGEICDKVILMAHDYQWTSVPNYLLGTTGTNNPVTPISKVYSTLKSITDPVTGVADRSKIVLQLSFGSCGMEVDENKRLVSTKLYGPGTSTVYTRLTQPDTEIGWSEDYLNPYAYYTTADGSRYHLWYEDSRSVTAKVELARMFGIHSISLWRLGTVPDYEDEGIYFDVWDQLMSMR